MGRGGKIGLCAFPFLVVGLVLNVVYPCTRYTGVALLVLPWLGFLSNTWLGAAIEIIRYLVAHPR